MCSTSSLLVLSVFFVFAASEGSRTLFSQDGTMCTEYARGGSCRANIEWTPDFYGPPGTGLHRRTLLYVYANQGEVLLLGSSSMNVSLGDILVYDPGQVTGQPGNELVPELPAFSCRANQPSSGRISTREEERMGPKDLSGALGKGYQPCYYYAPRNGIYNVVFYGPNAHNFNETMKIGGDIDLLLQENFDDRQGNSVAAWDVTVRKNMSEVDELNGRVFSYAWCMITGQNSRPVHMTVYPVTPDGFRYRLSTAGLDANFWPVYGSSHGFKDSDLESPTYHDVRGVDHYLSRLVNYGALDFESFASPSIPHFLSAPDDSALLALNFSVKPQTPFLLNFTLETKTIIQQGGATFCLKTKASYDTVYEIVIFDTFAEKTADPTHAKNRVLRGVVKKLEETYVYWDGKNNEGTFFTVGDFTVQVEIHGGEFHSIMIDAEANLGGGPQIELLNYQCVNINCRSAYFDHRGYRLANGIVVGAMNEDICYDGDSSGSIRGKAPKQPVPILTSYDTFSLINSFGVSNGIDKVGEDCKSNNSFGDSKALDVWTYTRLGKIAIAIQVTNPVYAQTFVSTWQTNYVNETIFLPLYLSTVDLTAIEIDWGDDSVLIQPTSYNISHTYKDPKYYTIKISGQLRGFNFRYQDKNILNFISIEKWGGFIADETSVESFARCENFRDITANDQPIINPGANFTRFFYSCFSLNPYRLSWDLSPATSLREMFAGCLKFNARVDFTLTNVTDLSMMFAVCPNFNRVIEFKNTSKVTTIESMFMGCSSFNSAFLIDTSRVLSMWGLFRDCVKFNRQISISTASCLDMSYMFFNCHSLNVPISLDALSVVNMNSMFMNCVSFNNHISMGSYNVKYMSEMFRGCTNFNFPISLNAQSCLDMSFMFADCYSFNQPVFLRQIENVTNMQYMFLNAKSFSQTLFFASSGNLSTIKGMFRGAESFNSYLFINQAKVTDMSELFFDAISYNRPLVSLALYPSVLETTASMFENAISFNQTITLHNSSRVRNMSRMFFGASSFFLLNSDNSNANNSQQDLLLNFDTSSVVDMSNMFAHAPVYGDNFGKWVVRQVEQCAGFCEFCGLPSFELCEACPSRAQTGRGTLTCGCPDGLTPSSNALAAAACEPVLCVQEGYTGEPGKCECAPGYVGKVEYLNNVTAGCAGAVACNETEGYTGSSSNCSCASGYYGTVKYTGNITIGCAPVTCPLPAFIGVPGKCTCAPAYSGIPIYVGSSVTGCSRNDSTVVVPILNSSAETIVNATDGVIVVLPKDPQYGGQGTVVVTTTNKTQDTVSTIVTIDFLDPSNKPKEINNLTFPFRFSIPLNPGASDAVSMCEGRAPVLAVPKCKWFDTISRQWTSEGCTTLNLTTTTVECSCVHMTDFALVLPNYNRVPLQQFLDLTPVNIKKHPDGILTVCLILLLFVILLILSARRDCVEMRNARNKSQEDQQHHQHSSFSSTSSSMSKWNNNVADVFMGSKTSLWRRFKLGLQVYHTWAALLCRKSGTSFRSVDRVFVTLMMVLTLMSMSANFHRRDQNYFGRTIVIFSSVLASLVPSQLLAFLFRHTGEMGYLEKWQIDMGLQQLSRNRCLRYRFNARWRSVWYSVVLMFAVMLILYILSIALMFDQNPWYYCRGQTTQAWILDFLLQYTITVFVVEPFKIFLIVLIQSCMSRKPKSSRPSSAMMLEAACYQPLRQD